MSESPKGQIVTFYSYKGGVGRSMAVANVAAILAQSGHRVLAIDFDLEAPGLHRYFSGLSVAGRSGRGTIDLFRDIQKTLRDRFPDDASYLADPKARDVAITEILSAAFATGAYECEVEIQNPNNPSRPVSRVNVMLAGNFDDDYAEHVRDFDWKVFYRDYAEVFPILIRLFKERYDWILIDSRTGVTDIGSICTAILPDKLLLVFSPNDQSLHGALDIGRQAVEIRRSNPERRWLPLFPILSRLDPSEEKLKSDWVAKACEAFAELIRHLSGGEKRDFSFWFSQVRIPYSAYYAYGEKIAAEKQSALEADSLAGSYAALARALQYDSPEDAQYQLAGAAAELSHRAREEVAQGNLDRAELLIEQALQEQSSISPASPAAIQTYMALGDIKKKRYNLIDAIGAYERALASQDEGRDLSHPDTLLSLTALVELHRRVGHFQKAEEYYRRSLDILHSFRDRDEPKLREAQRRLEADEAVRRLPSTEPIRAVILSSLHLGVCALHPRIRELLLDIESSSNVELVLAGGVAGIAGQSVDSLLRSDALERSALAEGMALIAHAVGTRNRLTLLQTPDEPDIRAALLRLMPAEAHISDGEEVPGIEVRTVTGSNSDVQDVGAVPPGTRGRRFRSGQQEVWVMAPPTLAPEGLALEELLTPMLAGFVQASPYCADLPARAPLHQRFIHRLRNVICAHGDVHGFTHFAEYLEGASANDRRGPHPAVVRAAIWCMAELVSSIQEFPDADTAELELRRIYSGVPTVSIGSLAMNWLHSGLESRADARTVMRRRPLWITTSAGELLVVFGFAAAGFEHSLFASSLGLTGSAANGRWMEIYLSSPGSCQLMDREGREILPFDRKAE